MTKYYKHKLRADLLAYDDGLEEYIIQASTAGVAFLEHPGTSDNLVEITKEEFKKTIYDTGFVPIIMEILE